MKPTCSMGTASLPKRSASTSGSMFPRHRLSRRPTSPRNRTSDSHATPCPPASFAARNEPRVTGCESSLVPQRTTRCWPHRGFLTSRSPTGPGACSLSSCGRRSTARGPSRSLPPEDQTDSPRGAVRSAGRRCQGWRAVRGRGVALGGRRTKALCGHGDSFGVGRSGRDGASDVDRGSPGRSHDHRPLDRHPMTSSRRRVDAHRRYRVFRQ